MVSTVFFSSLKRVKLSKERENSFDVASSAPQIAGVNKSQNIQHVNSQPHGHYPYVLLHMGSVLLLLIPSRMPSLFLVHRSSLNLLSS